MDRGKKSGGKGGGGDKIVILSTSTSTQIPNQKTGKKKTHISKQNSKHMSSYWTGEVEKNYKILLTRFS